MKTLTNLALAFGVAVTAAAIVATFTFGYICAFTESAHAGNAAGVSLILSIVVGFITACAWSVAE